MIQCRPAASIVGYERPPKMCIRAKSIDIILYYFYSSTCFGAFAERVLATFCLAIPSGTRLVVVMAEDAAKRGKLVGNVCSAMMTSIFAHNFDTLLKLGHEAYGKDGRGALCYTAQSVVSVYQNIGKPVQFLYGGPSTCRAMRMPKLAEQVAHYDPHHEVVVVFGISYGSIRSNKNDTWYYHGVWSRTVADEVKAETQERQLPPPPSKEFSVCCKLDWRFEDLSAENSPLSCAHCGHRIAPKVCGQCKDVHYCGRECQTTHWPAHKKECKARLFFRENLKSLARASSN